MSGYSDATDEPKPDSIFCVAPASPIEAFERNFQFLIDTNESKVNLTIGGKIPRPDQLRCEFISAYRDEDSNPYVLPVVRKVVQELAADEALDHDYQTVPGFEPFLSEAISLAFGASHSVIEENRVWLRPIRGVTVKLSIAGDRRTNRGWHGCFSFGH